MSGWVFVFVTLLVCLVRLTFDGREPTLVDTYIDFAHIWMGVLLYPMFRPIPQRIIDPGPYRDPILHTIEKEDDYRRSKARQFRLVCSVLFLTAGLFEVAMYLWFHFNKG